ncbi:MAG TPA: energy coupling factor transporter S component ThiW [Virgibacillus sp.]|nr:energy coupling factor transporter S component ThiW [Virgibacillus sp.]
MGTGVISSLFSVPFSKYVMGISHGAFFFMPSFMISSVAGALIGWVLLLKVQPAVLR